MSQDTSANNKRIAKNTLLLYVRMLLLMAVNLYAARVTLDALGIEDYGIYNVVGGVVAMFAIISGTLTAAIQRFITFELGKGDIEKLKTIFSTSVTIQMVISVIIVIIAETAGVWFVNFKMSIPTERLTAANWVLQCSIATFVINLISVPYNAAIIAHEKMSAFAYISILEAALKLLAVFALYVLLFDRLVMYAVLLFIVALSIRMVYGIYCKKKFEECTYIFCYDRSILRTMMGFAGWNFIGATSGILRDQGVNILINLFCGPAVNAARGISVQVNGAVHGFVNNFMTALNPQITKSYASGNHDYMMTLINQGARLSYYILLLLSLPLILEASTILGIWLKEVPDHTTLFVQLILILGMLESLSVPLVTAMLATGKIRNYQLAVGLLQILNFPLSYIFLKLGFFPEITMFVAIVISQACLVVRLIMLKSMIKLDVRKYIKNVYLNIVMVTLVSLVFPLLVHHFINSKYICLICVSFVSIIATILTMLFVGCNSSERQFVLSKIQNGIAKIKHYGN